MISQVNVPQSCQRSPKPSEEKKIDSFLTSENKKMASNLMRERNRKKKLRTQDLVMLSTSSEEKSSTLEASNVHNLPGIEKEKQNEMSVEHPVNVVSDNIDSRSLCDEKSKIP